MIALSSILDPGIFLAGCGAFLYNFVRAQLNRRQGLGWFFNGLSLDDYSALGKRYWFRSLVVFVATMLYAVFAMGWSHSPV